MSSPNSINPYILLEDRTGSKPTTTRATLHINNRSQGPSSVTMIGEAAIVAAGGTSAAVAEAQGCWEICTTCILPCMGNTVDIVCNCVCDILVAAIK